MGPAGTPEGSVNMNPNTLSPFTSAVTGLYSRSLICSSLFHTFSILRFFFLPTVDKTVLEFCPSFLPPLPLTHPLSCSRENLSTQPKAAKPVAKDNLELLSLLVPPPELWSYRSVPPYRDYEVLVNALKQPPRVTLWCLRNENKATSSWINLAKSKPKFEFSTSFPMFSFHL